MNLNRNHWIFIAGGALVVLAILGWAGVPGLDDISGAIMQAFVRLIGGEA